MISFKELMEKAVSRQQQKLMGLALARKRGDVSDAEVSDTVRDLAKSMSTKDLEKFAGTKHKGLPQKVDEAKSATGYDLYHKDFSSAMQHAYDFAKKKYGIEVDPREIDRKVASGPRKPSPGKTNRYRLKDKNSKKAIQVQVYHNDGNNKYELNMYKESVDYGSRMTDAQKKKFHALKKKMTGGPEYQKIMRKNQSPVKSDDEFHNLVLKKVMSEESVDEAVAIDGRTKTFKETMKRLQNRKMKLAEKEAKKPYLEMGTNEIVNKYAEMTPGQTNEAFKSSYDQAAGLAVAGAALAGRRKVGQAVSKVGKAVTGTAKKIAKFGASKPKPSAPSSAPAPTTPAKKSPSEDPRNVRRREKRAADKKAKADAAARKMKKAQDLVARQRARTRAAMGAKRGKV